MPRLLDFPRVFQSRTSAHCAADAQKFWVAGNFHQKATLLLVYAGLVALSKGVTELFLAFKLKSLRPHLDTV